MVDRLERRGRAPVGQPDGSVTLIEGATFCISSSSGDIVPGAAQGLFFRDTRFLSRLELTVNGHHPEPLSAEATSPFAATFVLRSVPRPPVLESALVIQRRRWVGRGMREDLVVHNYGEEAAYCAVELCLGADFAALADVRDGLSGAADGGVPVGAVPGGIVLGRGEGPGHDGRRGLKVTLRPEGLTRGDRVSFEFVLPAGGTWSTCLQLAPLVDGEEVRPLHRCGAELSLAPPQERLERWRREVPRVLTDHDGLRAVVARSADDLGALRIFDPEFPERAVVAAGAPWQMALHGRDALITAWMALLVDPDLAHGVLETLARFQGRVPDPRTDEEPGRILAEMRFGEGPGLLGHDRAHYGTADATPLFVMLLGELRRWGLVPELVDGLLPHADRALAWIEEYGDRDGDGYVEYQRASDRGPVHQGWRQSHNALRFADGRLARPPIALCEVQGYTYGAYLARAHFADEAGDEVMAARYRARARELKARFNRDFWLEDRGWFALGLDADKRPIDALGSTMGHCLWTGIIDEDKAADVAHHLVSDDLFSGWGIRTLARTMAGYNPMSPYNGSVWPHDNAVCAAGLMRYGFVDDAHQVILGMLDAAAALGHRLPELFGGLSRDEVSFPVRHPSACSPQAWAAASPLLFVRTLLRLDPWVPHSKVWLSPALPKQITELRVERIPLAGSRVTVQVSQGEVRVEGLAPGVELVTEPRKPLTA